MVLCILSGHSRHFLLTFWFTRTVSWEGLGRAFRLRHRLVHGVTSCSTDYAGESVQWALNATHDVRTVCAENDVNLLECCALARGNNFLCVGRQKPVDMAKFE
jgi:hypothetical protein